MAYSSGFHPHPRISYAGASPTGAASEAEYLEIGLARETDPEEVRRLLDESLPPGLDLLEVVEARGGSLPDRMEASRWRLTLPGVEVAAAADAVASFLAADEVPVERMTKKGLRSFDCRAAVVRLAVVSDASSETGCAILDTVLRHATPSVRPDDVLAGLREVSGLEAGSGALLERLAQGPLDAEAGTVGDPLAPDRDAG
jgi:radical SAM-linked protein